MIQITIVLCGLLNTLIVEISDLGILPDDAATVREKILTAAKTHDVIITTGGASRGEEDHMVNLIAEEGSLYGWQLAIKPGRPASIWTIG